MILTIDPGLRVSGVALWKEGYGLYSADLVKGAQLGRDADAWTEMAGMISSWTMARTPQLTGWVCEFPKVYTIGKSKGDPDDLLQLAGVVGALSMVLQAGWSKIIRPYEWKGQVPKAIMVERIQGKLRPEETARVRLPKAKSLQHNVWDAVGIGLWYWNRHHAVTGWVSSGPSSG